MVPCRNYRTDYTLRNIFRIYPVEHHERRKFRRDVIHRESPVGRDPPPFDELFALVDPHDRIAVADIDYKDHRSLQKSQNGEL